MVEKRFLILLENTRYTPSDIPTIRSHLSSLLAGAKGIARLTNIRVSSQNIQVDLYLDRSWGIPQQRYFERLLEGHFNLIEVVDLSVEHSSGMSEEEVIKRAVELFNQERFWEFHEALESLWRREPQGPKRELLQGMILVAAALVHSQKNRLEVGLAVLERALRKLRAVHGEAHRLPSINIGEFIAHVEQMHSAKTLLPFKIQ